MKDVQVRASTEDDEHDFDSGVPPIQPALWRCLKCGCYQSDSAAKLLCPRTAPVRSPVSWADLPIQK